MRIFFSFTYLALLLFPGCHAGNISSPSDGGPPDGQVAACTTDGQCDDENPCTDDRCADGSCQHAFNQAPCDDDQVCSLVDQCQDGVCVGSDQIDCDDDNPCTTDGCDDQTGCVNHPNQNPCDDASACTENDSCSEGSCTGTQLVCDDENVCTDNACDPATGCVFTNNSAPCDDETACTEDDTCSGGTCAGTPLVCDDENVCTDDGCDAAAGCRYTDNTAACDDDNACTNDSCHPIGGCENSDNSVACDDGNICTDNNCDPGTGCVYPNNTVACDDASLCTENDTCSDGICSGNPIVCDDDNICTDDDCTAQTGCSYTNNTVICTDANACTENDSCNGGACAGTPIVCDDDNICTDNDCHPQNGCFYTNNTIGCDDANACTENDSCNNSACTGTPVVCDDQLVCTDNDCHPQTGCFYTNNSTNCEDGDACTEGDTCNGGACLPGAPPDCDDQSNCTSESCQAASGCVYQDLCDPHAGCVGGDCVCNADYEGDGFSCTPVNLCPDGFCSADEDFINCPQDCNHDLVVVVEQALESSLPASLIQYLSDLQSEGRLARVEIFSGGTVDDLKTLLFDQVDRFGVEGALLVGNLPAAWYEQTAFDTQEQFPLDFYLQDRYASWTDADSNGRFDAHSTLTLEIFVSRLTGTAVEIQDYFAKIHDYRSNGSLVDPAAYNFIDDDWEPWAGTYGLESIYQTVEVLSDLAQTSRANYLAKLTGTGAEYVYQWIHASPTTLYVAGTGGGTITAATIVSSNFKGSFYNLFNCSAARFTQTNLAMTYTTRTDYGLAAIGSTKTGGIYTPSIFHSQLALGSTWGESFRQWYNGHGKYNDEWHLGIVIVGDPLLVISGDVQDKILALVPREWTAEDLAALRQTMVKVAQEAKLGTYESYRKNNPSLFEN